MTNQLPKADELRTISTAAVEAQQQAAFLQWHREADERRERAARAAAAAISLLSLQQVKMREAAQAGARCYQFDYTDESETVIRETLTPLGFKVTFTERTDWHAPGPGEPGDRGDAYIRKSVLVEW